MAITIRKNRGTLFVLSAPSGAGKSVVAEGALEKLDNFERSVSHTTRAIRGNETDGVDYNFVDEETFKKMVEDNAFLEWAKVHGNYYGTSFENIRRVVEEKGSDLLLVIDVQGANALRDKDINLITIFLLPPSLEELERRLKERGDESDEAIAVRLKNAKGELSEVDKFDYAILNDDLNEAVEELKIIVGAAKLRISNMKIDLNNRV